MCHDEYRKWWTKNKLGPVIEKRKTMTEGKILFTDTPIPIHISQSYAEFIKRCPIMVVIEGKTVIVGDINEQSKVSDC